MTSSIPTFHLHGLCQEEVFELIFWSDLHQFFPSTTSTTLLFALVDYARMGYGIEVPKEQVSSFREQERVLLGLLLDQVAREQTHHIYVLHEAGSQGSGFRCLVDREASRPFQAWLFQQV